MPEISLLQLAARPLACVRLTTSLSRWPGEFMHSLNKVYDAVRAGQVRKGGHNIMVYRPRQDGLTDIECGIETDAEFSPVGEVVYSETPSGMAVAGVHTGPYQQMGTTHQAIAQWPRAHEHASTGIVLEIYGDWEEDPSRLTTEIFHMVRSAETPDSER